MLVRSPPPEPRAEVEAMPVLLDEALDAARLSMTNVKLKSFLKWVLKKVWALDERDRSPLQFQENAHGMEASNPDPLTHRLFQASK